MRVSAPQTKTWLNGSAPSQWILSGRYQVITQSKGIWYCWWFRNPAITTWDVKKLINNGKYWAYQLVQDSFHQQYHIMIVNLCWVSHDILWPTCIFASLLTCFLCINCLSSSYFRLIFLCDMSSCSAFVTPIGALSRWGFQPAFKPERVEKDHSEVGFLVCWWLPTVSFKVSYELGMI